ncbi:Ribonuclease P protein subunit p14 [Phytophthora pseudosyringae]|uniref:Ribonuclease P protein subunit p14 n=1 Tax=Phytophthora pseudosyringae TaxID=221518 RepID=A0A8T1VL22_9STRA|nr:Ribonuclease P protein subunit p14 [Phytophthora pseudosyringae]
MLLRRGWKRATRCRALSSSASRGLFVVEGELTQASAIPAVGVEARVTHAFSIEDTRAFARLSGDSNPLHVDADFALQHAAESKPVVQGLLSASLFATIFGRTVPGAVYVKQDLRWRAPLLVDEEVAAHIRVVKVRKRFVECETVCTKASDGVVVVDGHATLLLPSPANQEAGSS